MRYSAEIDRDSLSHITFRLFVNGAFAGAVTLRADEFTDFKHKLNLVVKPMPKKYIRYIASDTGSAFQKIPIRGGIWLPKDATPEEIRAEIEKDIHPHLFRDIQWWEVDPRVVVEPVD
jgi:hypothetical protein